ncbi:cytochrome b-c1 complex subunit 7 [Platysternon megacephalum]|uniref:Cytochrome b-c1 complex subunit 7 n=1 Tax=Platysternon megacephalum TaxID=55544 RepID=A0A4D9EF96_9SAUR|nr:cytochrome b-c1 complex subunit 7 [Platysternon megacephalum]
MLHSRHARRTFQRRADCLNFRRCHTSASLLLSWSLEKGHFRLQREGDKQFDCRTMAEYVHPHRCEERTVNSKDISFRDFEVLTHKPSSHPAPSASCTLLVPAPSPPCNNALQNRVLWYFKQQAHVSTIACACQCREEGMRKQHPEVMHFHYLQGIAEKSSPKLSCWENALRLHMQT